MRNRIATRAAGRNPTENLPADPDAGAPESGFRQDQTLEIRGFGGGRRTVASSDPDPAPFFKAAQKPPSGKDERLLLRLRGSNRYVPQYCGGCIMIKVKIAFDIQRTIRRCRRKKVRVRLVIAFLFALMGVFFLCFMGGAGIVCQASGILNESDIRMKVKYNDMIKMDVDGQSYIINGTFSEIEASGLRELRAALKSIEGKRVDFKYWSNDRVPTVLELNCDGKEYVSFEPTYSNIKKNRVETEIISSFLIVGAFLWILTDLSILRIYCRHKGQRAARLD